jgi:hypothetical protein
MGIYSDNAKVRILNEQEKAERVKNSYCTCKFFGGAEIVVVAKNDSEAEKFEKLLVADFSRLEKKYSERQIKEHGIERIEYDGNDFTLIKEGKDCGSECADKEDAKPAKEVIKDAREKVAENFTDLLD